ncbi:MAG: competence/damage-inducible protein A [Bacteroidales bacterium]|nr:competence/damage-inducible protein A [Bacteroidales bacterium]
MNENKVVILSIGDEILIGQIVNTNAVWMAEKLNESGFNVVSIQTAGDTYSSIWNSLDYAKSLASLILVTGGLGPTKDDITKKVVADFFNSELVIHEDVLTHVESFFQRRGRVLTDLNRLQAMIPHNCIAIPNSQGTAPGMYFIQDEKHFVFMPGVPFEMQGIMESWVIPQMKAIIPVDTIVQKTVLTHGMGESFLADKISLWEDNLPENISLAYLPSPGKVRLRLRGKNTTMEEIDKQISELGLLIPDYIFGFDNDSLELVVGKLLNENNFTLAIAESCTGGYLSHLITEVPGSSTYFLGSVIAYSNDIKSSVLGVDSLLIQKYGAVSQEVALQMAENTKRKFNSDFALATTGIAGPDGGSIDKPVGTVWIALAGPNGILSKKFQFGDHRLRNISLSANSALNMLRLSILKEYMPNQR